MLESLKRNWVAVYFAIAVLLVVFTAGMFVGAYRLFPYTVIMQSMAATRDWRENMWHNARLRPDKHLRKARQSGSGVLRNEPGRYPGNTLISAFWEDNVGLRLFDSDGNTLHRWDVSFNEIWPDAPHLWIQPHDWDTNIHGFVAYPNGDIVFNFEHHGLVRIDRCSQTLWKLPRHTHHVVQPAANGNLWVADSKSRHERDPEFPLISPPYYEEFLLEVTPEGEIVREISVLEILYGSGWENLALDATEMQNGIWRGGVGSTRKDITHINDIEPLPAAMADAFPNLAPGDLALSLRNLDLVMLVDGEDFTVKAAMTGPWLMQHDPDFLPDGRLLVFDNRARMKRPDRPGSRILAIDPLTRDWEVIYEGSPGEPFFTSQMGRQQPLPNGNLLIAEPDAGRVFELDKSGKIVWEFLNRWSDEDVALVSEAQRLDTGYFDFDPDAPGCE